MGIGLDIYPSFIQLLDDDIVSLIGLRVLANPSHHNEYVFLTSLNLSLYLTAQCQIKLRHSPTSLQTTLHYVQLARARGDKHKRDIFIKFAFGRFKAENDCDIDQLLLTFVEQKILRYISAAERRNATIRGPRHFLRSGPLPSDLKLELSGAPYHEWGPRH